MSTFTTVIQAHRLITGSSQLTLRNHFFSGTTQAASRAKARRFMARENMVELKLAVNENYTYITSAEEFDADSLAATKNMLAQRAAEWAKLLGPVHAM